jgi:hypothetical protein
MDLRRVTGLSTLVDRFLMVHLAQADVEAGSLL